jgi:dnd system-associated protein 4
MSNIMKAYRVKRPKQYDELLNLLRDKDTGVFDTLKSALVFAAAIGFKNKIRIPILESGESIAFNLFSETKDQPFVFALALSEYQDVNYLRDENFQETAKVFEEYAHGGLQFLDTALDKSNIKESMESILAEAENEDLVGGLGAIW